MQLLFRMYDVNKTGTLNKEEVTVLIKLVKTSPTIIDIHFAMVIIICVIN